MKTKAYSYQRFSSARQASGTSLMRQSELSKSYAEEHGLELDDSLSMTDMGVSAFKGANISEDGALKAFLNAIDNGKVAAGSYLLVESLDRLSREKVTAALRLFLDILARQIIIVTLLDGKVYDDRDNDMDPQELIISIIIMTRAHEESKTKSERVRRAWKNKRENTDKKKLTKWSPKWLYLTEDRSEFLIHEDRAAIVKDIFTWSANGLGTSLIIRKLEEAGIEPWDWGEKGMEHIRPPKKWYGSYIQKLMHSRAVLGEFSHVDPEDPTSRITIPDYYPRVISDNLFYRTIAARKSRDVNRGGLGAGRKGKTFSNLFTGIVFCGYSVDSEAGVFRCDGDFEKAGFTNKGGKYRYLQCNRVKNGNSGCSQCTKMWRYDRFEKSFLSFVKDIDVSEISGVNDQLGEEIRSLEKRLKSIEGERIELDSQITKLVSATSELERIPKALIASLNDYETQVEKIIAEADDLEVKLQEKKAERSLTENYQSGFNALLDHMESCDEGQLFELRAQLAGAIKQVVDHILIFPSGYNLERSESDYEAFEELLAEVTDTELSGEMIEELRAQFEDKGDRNTNPFFMVFYKSGKQTIVTPDPKDASNLLAQVTADEDGNVLYASDTLEPITELLNEKQK